MIQLALLVFGIYILVKRKVTLSKNKVVTGGPAVAIGAIFVGLLPFGFFVGLVLGAALAGSGNEESLMTYALALDFGLILVAVVLAFIIAMMYGKPAEEPPAATGTHFPPPGATSTNPPPASPPSSNPFSEPPQS